MAHLWRNGGGKNFLADRSVLVERLSVHTLGD